MADKRTKEEIIADIRLEDATRDVPINVAVSIAVLSAVASVAGTVACLAIGFLEIYRQDVIAFWMACMPFCFPFITGIAVAYRKKLSCIGVHISMLLAALLAGGAGYGYSIEPVYLNRHRCIRVSDHRGDCRKDTLLYLYLVTGAVALGFSLVGLVYSLFAWSCAAKRRAKREAEEHEKQIELQKRPSRRSHDPKLTLLSPISPSNATNHAIPHAGVNSVVKEVKTECSNGAVTTERKSGETTTTLDATTHL
ncbi:unnamed protein product [Lymnaea stagnalis]|uniref:Uncharacterized protein n=1 Tax=Lymnaea stagnalis TaxID=6523 RepID=A0AAV2HW33_LYMST